MTWQVVQACANWLLGRLAVVRPVQSDAPPCEYVGTQIGTLECNHGFMGPYRVWLDHVNQ